MSQPTFTSSVREDEREKERLKGRETEKKDRLKKRRKIASVWVRI